MEPNTTQPATTVDPSLAIPEWVSPLLWAAFAVAAIWLIISIFVAQRRKASNLTSVHSAHANKNAAPDFMTVDHKAREEQIKRGEAYDHKLHEREKAEAAGKAGAAKKQQQFDLLKTIASIGTVLFSIFSLVSTMLGVFSQVDRMNQQISKSDALFATVAKYPIPLAVCIFVLGYHLVTYFTKKKWQDPPKMDATPKT